jgi:hypothetical protein
MVRARSCSLDERKEIIKASLNFFIAGITVKMGLD